MGAPPFAWIGLSALCLVLPVVGMAATRFPPQVVWEKDILDKNVVFSNMVASQKGKTDVVL